MVASPSGFGGYPLHVMTKPLSALEDATLRGIIAMKDESDGWLDLTRICSRVGRHLADIRQSVARLDRYGLIEIVETAPDNERWVKFALPEEAPTSD